MNTANDSIRRDAVAKMLRENLPGGHNLGCVLEELAAIPASIQANRCAAFGEGKIVVTTGEHNGRYAVYLAAAKNPGDVGSSSEREALPLDSMIPGEDVLTFPTREQALRVQAALCNVPASPPPAVGSAQDDPKPIESGRVSYEEHVRNNPPDPSCSWLPWDLLPGWSKAQWSRREKADATPSPSPASVDEASDLVLMPRALTAENGAKELLIGEFCATFESDCPECDGEGEEGCEICGGTSVLENRVVIDWTTIKQIYATAVAALSLPAPAQVGEKEEAASAVYTCILRGINDLMVSKSSLNFVDGWLSNWAVRLRDAGYKPNSGGRDVDRALSVLPTPATGGGA